MSKKGVMSHGQANELVTKLEEAGLTGDMAQAVIKNPDNRLAQDWVRQLNSLLGGQVTWGEVVETFGQKAIAIGVANGLRLWILNPTFYDRVPVYRAYLEAMSRRGLFLVAMPPVSQINLVTTAPKYFYYDRDYFRDSAFAGTVARGGYHLMFPVFPMSQDMTFREQLNFRPRDMGTLFAVEVAYTAIAWRILTDRNLLPDWVRCADEGPSRDTHVAVKQLSDGRVIFDFLDDNVRSSDVKIACGCYLNG